MSPLLFIISNTYLYICLLVSFIPSLEKNLFNFLIHFFYRIMSFYVVKLYKFLTAVKLLNF